MIQEEIFPLSSHKCAYLCNQERKVHTKLWIFQIWTVCDNDRESESAFHRILWTAVARCLWNVNWIWISSLPYTMQKWIIILTNTCEEWLFSDSRELTFLHRVETEIKSVSKQNSAVFNHCWFKWLDVKTNIGDARTNRFEQSIKFYTSQKSVFFLTPTEWYTEVWCFTSVWDLWIDLGTRTSNWKKEILLFFPNSSWNCYHLYL